jgi:hypothetical protein
MPFQALPGLVLSGTVSPSIVTDPNLPPTDIIESGVPFTVRIDWSVTGPAVPLMAGTWNVAARFEAIGPGPEILLAAPSVPFVAGAVGPPTTRTYIGLTSVAVPAGALPVGAYTLVVLLTFVTPGGLPGPLAGFSDQRIIQIFPNTPITVP